MTFMQEPSFGFQKLKGKSCDEKEMVKSYLALTRHPRVNMVNGLQIAIVTLTEYSFNVQFRNKVNELLFCVGAEYLQVETISNCRARCAEHIVYIYLYS